MTLRGWACTALAAAGMTGLAGCGGSDGELPMAATEQTPPKQAPAEETAAASGVSGLRIRQVASFSSPGYLTAPPGDRRRLFVVEQGGTIRVVKDGRKLGRPYLDISEDVQAGGEQGLLSMAFAP